MRASTLLSCGILLGWAVPGSSEAAARDPVATAAAASTPRAFRTTPPGPEDGGPSGWPFTTGAKENYATPVTADLDGDGILEVVFGSFDGNLYAVDAAGGFLWRKPLFHPGRELEAALTASASIADVDGDPSNQEVLAVSGHGNAWGRLYVLDAEGNELATFETSSEIQSPPVVLDTDGDGTMEVYFGSAFAPFTYQRVDLRKHGEALLPRLVWSKAFDPAESGFFTPAAAGDLFGDGETHLIVSSAGQSLFAVDPANGAVHWSSTTLGGHGSSAPVVVDLDGDGWLEVLQGSEDGFLYALDGPSGGLRWRFKATGVSLGQIRNTPVAHDFDGDGTLEIVVASSSPGVPADYLHLVRSNGSLLWAVPVDGAGFGYSSPAVGDIDQDGKADIVIGTERGPQSGSFVMAFDDQGSAKWKVGQSGLVYCSPSLTDLDGDGLLEVLFGVYDFEYHVLDHQGLPYAEPLSSTSAKAPWPSIHRNAQNNRVH